MMTIRRAQDRGRADFGWLDARHSFSFGGYFDPLHMGFSALRVINEDRIAPAAGFDTHGHADMEIVTVVLEGALEHRDSLGSSSIIRPGEVQRMSAGTGIRHSEHNHSKDNALHLMQIWILPDTKGLKPGYEQKDFGPVNRDGPLQLVGSRDGRDGSVLIHQDISLYRGQLKADEQINYQPDGKRALWLQLIEGSLSSNGSRLSAGDAGSLVGADSLALQAETGAQFLLFDLAV